MNDQDPSASSKNRSSKTEPHLRKEPVMLDSELALLYGVETGPFNRTMQWNAARFPADFAFSSPMT